MTPEPHRRPIAVRNLAVTGAIADWLVRRRVSPDAISAAGMLAAIVAGLAFAATTWMEAGAGALWVAGAVLVPLRLLANLLDGMVAVGCGIASPRGELWNEVPDRVSDTAVLVGLGVAGGSWALGLAAALAAMATAYVRAAGKAAGAPSDFRGPMAKQQRMAMATLVALWCGLAPASWQVSWIGLSLPALALVVITALSVVTAGRRLAGIARAFAR
jgi:phosphatidylglycerophosphate synthase